MFGAIARRYDLANHTLSCGIDFYWRKRAANTVASWQPGKIVDLATGTGDLALALQKKLPDAEVTGVDFLPEMLELAQRKGVRQTILADAMKLPFPMLPLIALPSLSACVTWRIGEARLLRCRGCLGETAIC
jgi:demethylmenaquinone methyltransferase/2-methoxy-6-polyprenyl-1,4-benzoquinol methylase